MEIRKAVENDLKGLIKVYKEVFKVHNVFDRPEEEIEQYLKKFSKILVAEEDGNIVGGLVITEKKYDKAWKLINFKHRAVASAYQGKDIGSALLKEAEKIAGKGKVEIRVGEREAVAVEFYEKNGYQKEGTLKSHYRKEETCFVMGKVLE